MTGSPSMLKQLLDREEIVVIPGVYNALSARQAQAAGFEAAYISGYALAAAYLAQPDVGLVSYEENRLHAAAIAAAAESVPVIADIDGGYGNVVNVVRTIREFERAGLCGVDINDQIEEVCPHLDMPRALISAEEMVGRLRAIDGVREDPDFCVLMKISTKQTDYAARGDAFEEFQRRAVLYAEAGADAIICGWQPAEEYEQYARVVRELGLPPVAVEVPFRSTPSAKELQGMGFAGVLQSVDTLYAAYKAHQQVYETLKRDGSVAALRGSGAFAGHDEFMELVRVNEVKELSERYLVEKPSL